MKTITAFIERGKDGSYGIYLEDNTNLDYGVIGEGGSVKEAIKDFNIAYNEIRAYYKDEGKMFEEVKFQFAYDVPSFLTYYSDIFTKSALERMTGINQTQLTHYVSGYRKPSKKTVRKLDDAIRLLADELSQVHFVGRLSN
jgi:hypothetical protein